jgi:hypothetical protein
LSATLRLIAVGFCVAMISLSRIPPITLGQNHQKVKSAEGGSKIVKFRVLGNPTA